MRAVRDVDKVVVQQSRAELDGCWGKEVNIGTGGGAGASRDGVKGVGGAPRTEFRDLCLSGRRTKGGKIFVVEARNPRAGTGETGRD